MTKFVLKLMCRRLTILIITGVFLNAHNAAAVPSIDISVGVHGLGTSTGGPLAINRIELLFDNNRGEVTVPINSRVKVKALINYTGNGILQAQWIVDGRIIQQVNRSLAYGTDIVVETGEVPPLPTFDYGRHTVTLQITNPAVSFSIPVIEYFVATLPALPGKTDIRLYLPGNGAFLYKDKLAFSWNDPAETGLYQVIVWQGTRSVINALTRDSVYLPPPAMLRNLTDGMDYTWQVIALGKLGREAGRSEVRGFRVREDTGKVIFREIKINEETAAGRVKGRIPPEERFRGSRNINISKTVKIGDEVTIHTVVENWSRKPARQVIVEFKADGELVSRQVIPELQPGEYEYVYVPVKAFRAEPVQESIGKDTDYDIYLPQEEQQGMAMFSSNARVYNITVEARIMDKVEDTATVLLDSVAPAVAALDFTGRAKRSVGSLDFTGIAGGKAVTGLDFVGTKGGGVYGKTRHDTGASGLAVGGAFILPGTGTGELHGDLDFMGTVGGDLSSRVEYCFGGVGSQCGSDETYSGLDFGGTIAKELHSGLDFSGRLTGESYRGLDFSGSFAGEEYGGLDFSGTIGGDIYSGLDFSGELTLLRLGRNDATGVNFTAHTLGRNDATGVDFTAHTLGRNDATGVNFTAHALGRNDATGVDFTAHALGRNDATGVDFTAHALGRNDATGVDFTAHALGRNDATGVDFTAHAIGRNDATGVDFTAHALGRNDATGVDFTAHALGQNDATGVDFTAHTLGRNDATGVDFTAHALGQNDATGVDFTAHALGRNDATGVDFTAHALGRNDATGVDFTAHALGRNDATGVDFIATPIQNWLIGPTRLLTASELTIARSVFGDSLDYNRVRISSTIGFSDRAWTTGTPDPLAVAVRLGDIGNIGLDAPADTLINVLNVGEDAYTNGMDGGAQLDLSPDDPNNPLRDAGSLLIHELTHAWQSQHGNTGLEYMVNSMMSQAVSGANGHCAYIYQPGKPFGGYGAEQIASIVEDYYIAGENPAGSVGIDTTGDKAVDTYIIRADLQYIVNTVRSAALNSPDSSNLASLSTPREGCGAASGSTVPPPPPSGGPVASPLLPATPGSVVFTPLSVMAGRLMLTGKRFTISSFEPMFVLAENLSLIGRRGESLFEPLYAASGGLSLKGQRTAPVRFQPLRAMSSRLQLIGRRVQSQFSILFVPLTAEAPGVSLTGRRVSPVLFSPLSLTSGGLSLKGRRTAPAAFQPLRVTAPGLLLNGRR